MRVSRLRGDMDHTTVVVMKRLPSRKEVDACVLLDWAGHYIKPIGVVGEELYALPIVMVYCTGDGTSWIEKCYQAAGKTFSPKTVFVGA